MAYLKEVLTMVKIGSSTLCRWMDNGIVSRPRQSGERWVRWMVADIKEWQDTRQTEKSIVKTENDSRV
ncbi:MULTISPECIES: AlpA family phage regulatory protein [Rhizobium/Agrobacterium group]|uniref:helix-turn-helix transcriptional regulator n=1 Tax=Agrobacterium tumefaciens complex TaxID=1183400 RepID=UPI0013E40BB9|nr:AlpA family phage regulatory protein [Agrobacterium tumefaciens]NTC47132.1 AlpA family phage regulatory protein [Agrobacterium tumefaciens]